MSVDERTHLGRALIRELQRSAALHHVKSDVCDVLQYEADAISKALTLPPPGATNTSPESVLLGPWGQTIHRHVCPELLNRVAAFWNESLP